MIRFMIKVYFRLGTVLYGLKVRFMLGKQSVGSLWYLSRRSDDFEQQQSFGYVN
jgi:hypothetical protein